MLRLVGPTCSAGAASTLPPPLKPVCPSTGGVRSLSVGEWVVAHDFLTYLNTQVDLLRRALPAAPALEAQLVMTERLIGRITALLAEG